MSDDQPIGEEGLIHLDWQPVPFDDPVERVARALCKFDGHDPDAMASSDRREPVLTEDGIAFLRDVAEPAWKKYVREASRLVAAFQAFNGSLG